MAMTLAPYLSREHTHDYSWGSSSIKERDSDESSKHTKLGEVDNALMGSGQLSFHQHTNYCTWTNTK